MTDQAPEPHTPAEIVQAINAQIESGRLRMGQLEGTCGVIARYCLTESGISLSSSDALLLVRAALTRPTPSERPAEQEDARYWELRQKIEELVFDPIRRGGRTEAEIIAELERQCSYATEYLKATSERPVACDQTSGETPWQPGKSIKARAHDLLETELNENPAEPTIAALRALEKAIGAEVKVTNALLAVWDDWITANDESGMDEYEIKDVAPETIKAVEQALRGRLYVPPSPSPSERPSESAVAWQYRETIAKKIFEQVCPGDWNDALYIDERNESLETADAILAIPHGDAMRAQTIEECAKVAELDFALRFTNFDKRDAVRKALADVAKAIRALSPTLASERVSERTGDKQI